MVALAASGCLAPPTDIVEPSEIPAGPRTPGVGAFNVECRLVATAGTPIAGGTCEFRFDLFNDSALTGDAGRVARVVPAGAAGLVRGSAAGHEPRASALVVDGNKSLELVLPPVSPTPAAEPLPQIPPMRWRWSAPLQVPTSGTEPHVAVAGDGTIYYSPTSNLLRSRDGGRTWVSIAPGLPPALPTSASDTSLSLAPDGSVWWTRYWGYAGGTIGCTSSDRGDSWTCDNLALPGVTDRMWIVGLDSQNGYLQTNEGLYHHLWARTDSGSQKYLPYATTTTLLAVRNGNMVYDAAHQAVWQVEWTDSTLELLRIDGATGVTSSVETRIPAPSALPWISARDGILWTTGEPVLSGLSRGLVVARSRDAGVSWDQLRIPTTAKSVTFSYVAAGPDGRVAVAYYGSDRPGPPDNNGGNWSLYVAETTDGLSKGPTWVQTQLVPLVHTGSICVGITCESTSGDPGARFSGDLMGCWIDEQGNVHVAYNELVPQGSQKNQFVRQWTRA